MGENSEEKVAMVEEEVAEVQKLLEVNEMAGGLRS